VETLNSATPGGNEPGVNGTTSSAPSRLDIASVRLAEAADLMHPKARALASQLDGGQIAYARLVGVRAGEALDVVEFEVSVDAVQHPVYDIRPVEPVAVVFVTGGTSQSAPEVLALREDFPEDAPHLLQRDFEYPRSLCLYDVRFRDVESQWTPARFVALIREWFRLTARGELHAEDQPLERLLTEAAGWVILPPAVLQRALAQGEDAGAVDLPLWFNGRPEHGGRPVIIGSLAAPAPGAEPRAIAAVLRTEPRVHGTLRRAPRTLADLHALLAAGGDDLVGQLRQSMRGWEQRESFASAQMVFLLVVPKRRTAEGPVESTEAWVFFADGTVEEVGTRIDAWQRAGDKLGVLLGFDPARDGRDVRVELGYTIYTQGRGNLARQNGRAAEDDRSIVSVGGGALGSQVMMNAARAAFGRWTVIDDDLVLPHNLARHAVPGDAVGYKKAEVLKTLANAVANEEPVHRAIVADVLAPGERAAEVESAFADADLILDVSASVAVARALARDVVSSARRVSLFLNPSGTDLTLLSEDVGRTTPLDLLEMQYYRAVARGGALDGALAESLSRVRYGRSCRDVSVALPQALVGLYAGLGTLGLDKAAVDPAANARVWRLDHDTLGVSPVVIETSSMVECSSSGWRVVTDEWLLWRLAELRASKLPSETGGVLVGTYDLSRRIVYLVETIPSPKDSHEYPTSYMRGAENLAEDVERITAATAGQLHYVGEWHSHPAGHSCHPSDADQKLFAWLAEELARDGLPPLMVIVGDGGVAVPYVDEIVRGRPYPGILRPGGEGVR
jgi:proteasome lid subunit RPN8/RPN11